MSARVVGGRLVGAGFLDDPKAIRVFEALDGNGEETRIVGGAIRNALLGAHVHEIDFATTAEPPEIIRRAQKAGLRTIPTGIDHGTVTVLVEGETFEATTLRHDVETDGRRAVVRFGRSFEEDALRRDFTMNALSVSRDGRLFDCTGGVADIERRHVRFIGQARQRIREDYLRILRFFRFHAAFGEGEMDADAFHAVIAERDGLGRLSRERVRAEMLKLLIARRGAAVVADVAGTGILGPLLGGVPHAARLARAAAIGTARGEAADPILRLAALRVQVVEDAATLLDALRLSNDEHLRLQRAAHALTKWRGIASPPGELALKTMLFRAGRQASLDALRLVWAESRAEPDDSAFGTADAFLREAPEPSLPFRGADLIARGLKPGPAMGAALAKLQGDWIASGFTTDPTDLDRMLAAATAG